MESQTYTLVLTEDERKMLIFCMGSIVPSIRHETIRLLPPEQFNHLAMRLMDARPDVSFLIAEANGIQNASGTDRARAILSPPAQSPAAPVSTSIQACDRWARDRKGVELAHPEGCIAQEVRIWKVETKTTRKGNRPSSYLQVTWESPTGIGHVDGNCFDVVLAAWVVKAQGTKTTLYTLRRGNYLNVVGVRA